MAPKNPFTPATAQVSPPSASSTRLRWHNSVAEDYSPVNENGGSFKRSASVAMPETCIDYPEQPFEHETPLHHTAPQNKKRKASASSSILSPGQPHQIPDTGLNTVTEGPNGEPAPVVKRKRGRPPKNPHPGNGSSQIEFVNVTDPRPKSKSGPSNSAPKTVRHQESPILQPLDTSFVYNNTSFHGMPHEITSGLEYQATAPWDTSFAASVMGDAAIMGSMTSDINLLDATSTFNWSMMPTTMGDMTPHDMVDPMRPLTMQSFSDSFYQSHLDASAVNFQFAQDPLSASDIISPVSVDPHLIFAGQALGQPFDDGLGSMQPYRQQNLDRQQEEQAQQKRQSKPKPSSKASSKSAKSVAPPASSRPAVNRALTESVLTKSSVSKYSNVTVQSGSAKQMSHRSASGKMRPSVKDENTTPSPSIGAMSVKHVSPASERARDNKKVRTAVNFSISPGGRAKAETIVVKDRRGSTRNRDEYEEQDPYDTDSSTDEDDLGPIGTGYSMNQQRAVNVKNRHHNSSFNRSMERPKLARFRTEPANSFSTSQYLLSGNFENDSFSYNNPFIPHDMSMSSGMLRKKKSHSKISRRQNGSSSFVSNKSGAYGSMREEEEYSEAETVVDEPVGTSAGDAILALKQAVARKHSRPSRPQTGKSLLFAVTQMFLVLIKICSRFFEAPSIFVWNFSPLNQTYQSSSFFAPNAATVRAFDTSNRAIGLFH